VRYPLALLPLTVLVFPAAARADDLLFKIDGRAGGGYAARFDQPPPNGAVAFEFGLGLRIGLEYAPRDAWVMALMPEVSYTALFGNGVPTLSGITAGVGIGRTNGTFLLGVVPSFVYAFEQTDSGVTSSTGYGGRLLLTAEITHWVGVQAGYQITSFNGTIEHDVRGTVSLNFLGLLIAYVLASRGSGL
jgi:hypothetical protein